MSIIHFFLHIDQYLATIIQQYGLWTYPLLFLIMFIETGCIIMPFLPGDSLLFAAGTMAAIGGLNIHWLSLILLLAAILGDAVNYGLGYWLGPKVFNKQDSFLFKKIYLQRAHAFYEKHGGQTIIFARFIPILRSFVPFIAGVARMDYACFTFFNVIGGIAWVYIIMYVSYFFGNIPVVRNNFSLVVVAIIVLSVVPMGIGYLRHKWCN